jgi:NADPH:quinone reductase-like Zn-dependent oxidoreductase
MNTLKLFLLKMGLSWTSLIELIIIILFFIIFCFWFSFLLLLGFLGLIGFKIWKIIQQIKKQNRDSMFNQLPKTMKAAYYSTSWSRNLDFGDYLLPEITKDDEILVKVYSASLNPVDYKIVFTRIPFYRWFLFPNLGIGKDFSGEVVQVGQKITQFKIGDNVFGFSKYGCFQEYTIAKENWVHIIPERIMFEQAAAVPLVGCTTYQALTYFYKSINNNENMNADFGYEQDLSGKIVLVIGASGGCGHIGIQIAKFLNATQVFGVCSRENIDNVNKLEACEEIFGYDSMNFESSMDASLLTEDGQPKVDIILDTVSSREDGDFGKNYMKYLKPDGEYVALNSSSIIKFCTGLIRAFIPKLNFEKKGTHVHMLNRDDNKGLEVLYNMMSQGRIIFLNKSVMFEPQAIEEAINMLKSRRTVGKLVCNIIEDNNQY